MSWSSAFYFGNGGADRLVPVAGVDVRFANSEVKSAFENKNTTVFLPVDRVSVTMKTRKLVTEFSDEELSAMFGAENINVGFLKNG